MTEEEIQSFEDCVEDALMREKPKKDEVDLWLDRLTPEQLAFVAWVSDAHPVDAAQEIECEIDAELPYPTIVTGGEVVEVRPYRQFVDLEGMPF